MSYTRSYSSSVNVTGSVSVSYPPSEHGGSTTAYYEQTVPVRFEVTVATEPFEDSISTAGAQVDGLTASVAAMSAANCVAIAQSSERISDSLIRGFYNLIQSDITTKKAESDTAIQTKFALLLEYSKAVQDKHERMLKDVNREHQKFDKVFNELNNELERRITEVNKPAFKFGNVREDVVVKPYLSEASSAADQLCARSAGSVAVARLRQKVLAVFRDLSDSLHNNLLYRHMLRDILWDKSIDKEQQLSYIPVVYCVSEDIESARSACRCYVSDNQNKNSILACVNSYIGERNDLEAKAVPDEEMKLIDQAFSSIVQDSYSSITDRNEYQERVYTEICRLWKDGSSKLKQV